MLTIVEIRANEFSAHRNRTYSNVSADNFSVPGGWALIPNGMETPNFPFGTVEAEKINGVMTLTKWAAGEIPEPPQPQPPEPTEQDDVNAMLVDHELRIMDLELGISEEEV